MYNKQIKDNATYLLYSFVFPIAFYVMCGCIVAHGLFSISPPIFVMMLITCVYLCFGFWRLFYKMLDICLNFICDCIDRGESRAQRILEDHFLLWGNTCWAFLKRLLWIVYIQAIQAAVLSAVFGMMFICTDCVIALIFIELLSQIMVYDFILYHVGLMMLYIYACAVDHFGYPKALYTENISRSLFAFIMLFSVVWMCSTGYFNVLHCVVLGVSVLPVSFLVGLESVIDFTDAVIQYVEWFKLSRKEPSEENLVSPVRKESSCTDNRSICEVVKGSMQPTVDTIRYFNLNESCNECNILPLFSIF